MKHTAITSSPRAIGWAGAHPPEVRVNNRLLAKVSAAAWQIHTTEISVTVCVINLIKNPELIQVPAFYVFRGRGHRDRAKGSHRELQVLCTAPAPAAGAGCPLPNTPERWGSPAPP